MSAAPRIKSRIVCAMSGGVDSSVTAALLKRAGHDVVGITLQLSAGAPRKGACCAGRDIEDARRVAAMLDIPHYVLDYQARFRDRVIADFADSYARGETPIPCVRCNERVKFADLMESARALGADALATGHYARRVETEDGPELHSACDGGRDQSYFLFATTRAQLSYLRFPLGDMEKSAVRAIAASLELPNAEKADSQDLCFVPDGRYARIVEKFHPARPGEIVDREGRVLGHHPGVIHFTIGQKKGLGLSGQAEPLFVLALDPAQARVVVGPRSALGTRRVALHDVNWLGRFAGPVECRVKVRSQSAPVAAIVTPGGGARAEVELLSPEEAVAPGQACVFYDGSRVVGGGWIASAAPVRAVA